MPKHPQDPGDDSQWQRQPKRDSAGRFTGLLLHIHEHPMRVPAARGESHQQHAKQKRECQAIEPESKSRILDGSKHQAREQSGDADADPQGNHRELSRAPFDFFESCIARIGP